MCYSSPKLVDLNKDNILDIIVGAGSGEWQHSDTAVIALDGTNGKLLWKVSARNQMTGSADFQDITADGIPEVFIGGRSAELKCINGADGKLIWEFYKSDDAYQPSKKGWYNFFNAQFITDQDHDMIRDLLITNGGDATASPEDSVRPAGNLMIISAINGKVIAQVQMPDGKETYMSPVVIVKDANQTQIYFGTGGETIAGNFYRVSLKELLSNDISKATILAKGTTKGFVAPPLLADVTQDGILDIIVNAVEGKLIAIDGVTDAKLWEVQIPNAEAYTSPTPGYFNDDEVPDFFINYAIGKWPYFLKSVQFTVDGKTGELISKSEMGLFSYASALSVDTNSDCFSEVILSVNYNITPAGHYEPQRWHKLVVLDIHNKTHYSLDSLQGVNWASTPWIGDGDGDGNVEFVYVSSTHNNVMDPENAASVNPEASFIIKKDIGDLKIESLSWGAYMGEDGKGIFMRSRDKCVK